MSRTTTQGPQSAQPRRRSPSQPLHQPKLVRMREQLMPGIDAHLGAELPAFWRLDIECEHNSPVGILLVRGSERGLPQAVRGAVRVRGERWRREIRLRQQPPRGELYPHVRGRKTIETCG